MIQIGLIGLGAGVAAALLFASVATGSVLATLLFYLAPLPILIAALGWSHWAGLVAAISAASGLGALLGVYFSGAFLVGVGIPAWWLAYLALLARPIAASGGATPVLEWYPLGRIVLWAAVIGTIVVVIAIPTFGTDKDTFQAGLRRVFERAIRMEPSPDPATANRPELSRLVDILVAAVPAAAAALSTLLNLVNLWLAARIAAVSGRLTRPWPDLSSVTLPGSTLYVLGLASAGAMLPDLFGVVSGVLTASLVMAYAIVGFAVLHAVTRGWTSRGLLLAAAYVGVGLAGWPLLIVALLGILDGLLNLRMRAARKRLPPPSK